MAMTGYFKTFVRPRTHRPLSMLKYDPVGTSLLPFVDIYISFRGFLERAVSWEEGH